MRDFPRGPALLRLVLRAGRLEPERPLRHDLLLRRTGHAGLSLLPDRPLSGRRAEDRQHRRLGVPRRPLLLQQGAGRKSARHSGLRGALPAGVSVSPRRRSATAGHVQRLGDQPLRLGPAGRRRRRAPLSDAPSPRLRRTAGGLLGARLRSGDADLALQHDDVGAPAGGGDADLRPLPPSPEREIRPLLLRVLVRRFRPRRLPRAARRRGIRSLSSAALPENGLEVHRGRNPDAAPLRRISRLVLRGPVHPGDHVQQSAVSGSGKNRRRAGNLLSPDRPETSLRLLSRTLSRLPPAAGGDSRLSPAAPPRPRGGMVCRGRVSRRSLDQRRIQRLARGLHHHGPLSDPAGAVSDFPRRDVAASKPPLPSPAAGSRRPLLL